MASVAATICVLSHRPAFARQALDSAWAQTVRCQVLLQDAEPNWNTKVNEIMATAKGEFVIPLCDDDLLDPQYVERCLSVAEHADVVYTDRRYFQIDEDPSTAPFFRIHGDDFPPGKAYAVTMELKNFIFGSSLPMTVMWRKSFWDTLGGYDPRMPHADTECWFRAVERGARMVYVAEPLFWYRQHAGQLSKLHDSMTPALRVFHRKHFQLFGVQFEDARPVGPTHMQVDVLPPQDRLAYAAAHFTSLTTHGYMAQERRELRPSAKRAIKTTIKDSEVAVNASIAEVFAEEGLVASDGWRVDTATFDAVREVADAAPSGAIDGEVQPSGPVLVKDVAAEA